MRPVSVWGGDRAELSPLRGVANRTISRWPAPCSEPRRKSNLELMAASPRQAVKSLLANERDAHRRQRELVRASLMLCPGKSNAQAAATQR
jgi:hypothetical protein